MATSTILCILAVVCVANAATPPSFTASVAGKVTSLAIADCSGMGASKRFPGVLYVLNDHGGAGPQVFAINATDASVLAVFNISPALENDWEDMAVGECGQDAPGNTCLYIADTGLYQSHASNVIYKIAEPRVLQNLTLVPMSSLKFTWDDPESDSIMVDPLGEVYIISKVLGGRGMIAHLPSQSWGQSTPVDVSSTAFLYAFTDHHDPVAADISPNGLEVIVKTREGIYYWSVPDGNYLSALTSKGDKLPYHVESYGEAACWSADGSKYYTLGEGNYQTLYVYTRM